MVQMEKSLHANGGYETIMNGKRAEYIAALENKEEYSAAAAYYEDVAKIKKQDYTEQITEYNYLQALSWKKNGSYKAAAEAFLKIYDYKDSATQMKESDYLYGIELFSKGKLKDAVLYLNKADDYSEAAELAKKVKYQYCLEHADAPDDQTRIYLEDLRKSGYPGYDELKSRVEEWKLQFELKEVNTYEVTAFLTFSGGPSDGMDGYKVVLHNKDGTTSTYIASTHISSGNKEKLSVKNANGGVYKNIKRIEIYTIKGTLIGKYSK